MEMSIRPVLVFVVMEVVICALTMRFCPGMTYGPLLLHLNVIAVGAIWYVGGWLIGNDNGKLVSKTKLLDAKLGGWREGMETMSFIIASGKLTSVNGEAVSSGDIVIPPQNVGAEKGKVVAARKGKK